MFIHIIYESICIQSLQLYPQDCFDSAFTHTEATSTLRLMSAGKHSGTSTGAFENSIVPKAETKRAIFAGGLIVLSGKGCRARIENSSFENSTLVVLGGAVVHLDTVTFHSSVEQGTGLAIYANGPDSTVMADSCNIEGGYCSAYICTSAFLYAENVKCTGAEVAGLEALGAGTRMVLTSCEIADMGCKFRNPEAVANEDGFVESLCAGVSYHHDASGVMVETSVRLCECGVVVQHGTVQVEMYNCEVTECGMSCLHFCGGAKGVIEGCKVSKPKHFYGLAVDGKDTKVTVKDCTMENTKFHALLVSTESSAEVENCVVKFSERASMVKSCMLTSSQATHGLECEHGAVVHAHQCTMAGNKDCGAAAFSGSSLSLTMCKAENNSVGFWAQGAAQLALKECRSMNNVRGCGAHGEFSRTTMEDVQVENDNAGTEALAVEASRQGEVRIQRCSLVGCGVVATEGGVVDMKNSTVRGSKDGTALQVSGPGTRVDAESCSFLENEDSGAAAIHGSVLRLVKCTAQGNIRYGFAVMLGATMELSDCNSSGSNLGLVADGKGSKLFVSGGVVEGCALHGMCVFSGATAKVRGLCAAENKAYSFKCAGVGSKLELLGCVSRDKLTYMERDGGRIKCRGCKPSVGGSPLGVIFHFKELDLTQDHPVRSVVLL
jgi:hypothetical protein